MKKKLYITTIVILILAIIGVGQFIFFQNSLKKYDIKGDSRGDNVPIIGEISSNPIVAKTQEIDQGIMSKVNHLYYNTGNPNDVWAINKELPSADTIKQEYDNAKKVSSSVVGWIAVQGTNINYPITYNKTNNNYYLTHNYRGDKWWNGAIFRDTSNTNWGHTVLINGHNMLNAVMFAELMNFRNTKFYNDNKYIELYDGTQAEKFKIVGAFYTEPNETLKFDMHNEKERLAYYKKMQARSIYGKEPVTDSKTLFINTCLSDGTGRHIFIMAQQVK